MPETEMERRLAALLAADVVGYSRLMGYDEPATLAALQLHRTELISPAITKHHGRIVKLMGDGILAEFGSVVAAVECAVEIQAGMSERNSALSESRRMLLRVGVHLGDVMVDEDDIYGDGVNIAARLESIADEGGVCLSRQALDHVEGKLGLQFKTLGHRKLKNIAKPVEVYAIHLDRSALGAEHMLTPNMQQDINYCRTPDGVRLAWAKVGRGAPLVKAANWMNHLEYDWESPVWHHLLEALATDHTLIRYDARGNGLSDWDVGDISLDAWVSDLATVVEAAGVLRFPLLGVSQGCAISIAYAVRNPDRVSHLILYGGFAVGGLKRSPAEKEKREAMATLMRLGWGANDPSFRQLFTSQFIPGGSKEQIDDFNELQRMTTSPECAVRYFRTVGEMDVRDLLPKVTAPTLVMHVRGDRMTPFEVGREMAAGISGARFVALRGENHLFLKNEPAADRFLEEVSLFLS
jgi:class 3 adenylate cyclase/pimeloyl-ACP methyl ester carboxylesterase